MKKTVLVLLLALISGWASAQRVRTYASEGFQGGPYYIHEDQWDIDASAASLDKLMYSPSQEAGGAEVWEGFLGYGYGLNVAQLEGTYRYILKKVNPLPVSNYVSVKYFYEANKNSMKGARIFGLAVRQEEGAWRDVRIVDEMSANLGRGMLVAKLPDDMLGAREVQVCVYYTTPKDNTQYLLYFDDFEFFACNAYGADFAWQGTPFTTNGQLDIDLAITNTGNVLTSCEISYTFDGGEVQTMPLTIQDSMFPGQVYMQENFVPAGWDATAYGKHTLEFWISKANGADVSTAHQVKYLTNINPATSAYQYRPLVEHFSSSSCGPCANLNQVMNPVYADLGDTISLIKYQMNIPANDPYATEEGILRGSYYNVYGVPSIVLDGTMLAMSGTYAGIAAFLRDSMLAATNKKVYYGMWFDQVAVDAAKNIHITLKVKAMGGAENVVLYTVVEEGTTHGNATTNGETEFHNVMMKMLPDNNGRKVTLVPDSVYTFEYVYDMTQTHMEDFTDLNVVAFLQTQSGEVLQSVIGHAGSYNPEAEVAVLVDYVPHYICAEEIPAGLQLMSVGGTPVTSVEIEGKVGTAGTPVSQTYAVSMAWSERAYVALEGLKATATGEDTVYFTVTKVNGVAVDGPMILQPVYVQPTQYTFLPFLEDFTSASNAGSAVLNQYVDAFGDEIRQVKYPMKGDRYTRSANTNYAAKIGIFGAPGLALNGCAVNVEDDGTLTNEDYFETLLAQVQRNPAIFKVEVDTARIPLEISGLSIKPTVTGSFKFESALTAPFSGLVYALLVEPVTVGNAGSNGETQIKHVVQAMLPGESGSKVNVGTGRTFVLNESVLNPQVENYDHLKLVLIFKDAADKEVLQTAEFPIANSITVANENVAAYGTLSVYPNPASEYVYLKGLENAAVDVFDMMGVKVFGLNGVNGDYTLDVRGYVPGAYIIKVREDAKVSVARINVVR